MIAYLMQDNRYISFVGIAMVLAISFLFSRNKRRINIRLVASALALQFALAFFILRTSVGISVFTFLARCFSKLYEFANTGSQFVFGRLADGSGPWGVIFAVKVIPIIIFFGAFAAVLFHFGIIQVCVRGISFVIRPLLGTSGAETLCAGAKCMLGQTEAPLLIKKYLNNMTDSEILVVMVSGMATMSGSILAIYGSMGVPMLHLLSASVIAIPGAILIAKILLPEVEEPETIGGAALDVKRDTKNVLEAISSGTTDGLHLAVNVAAMLIAFISLIALVNYMIGGLSSYIFGVRYTLDTIFAKLFCWIAFLIGVPLQDTAAAGTLLGQKLVINEFIAYSNFVKMSLTPRAHVLLTYALSGFANFSSIGIQIGGIGALAPKKRGTLIKLGLTAVLGGTLANLLSAAVAGLFI